MDCLNGITIKIFNISVKPSLYEEIEIKLKMRLKLIFVEAIWMNKIIYNLLISVRYIIITDNYSYNIFK